MQTMSRLKNLMQTKTQGVLNVYCTAGYPHLHSTLPIMQTLQASGVDIIELGMPYSDPLADGVVIQESSYTALANGMTIEVLLEQLQNCRATIHIPIVLMGYLNPILQYGFEAFCAKAKAVGIDGFIIPDLPMHEFENEYGTILKKYELDFIFLITPNTSTERIRKLDSLSSGFLYAVSSSATTGSTTDFAVVENYLQQLQKLQLHNPILVGFGIKDKESFNRVAAYSNGAIIGSAFIKALHSSTNIEKTTKHFVQGIIGDID
jgi:tryptophan synthase alpha chain